MIRHLLRWLVDAQIGPVDLAHSMRALRQVVTSGKRRNLIHRTLALLDSYDVSVLAGPRATACRLSTSAFNGDYAVNL